MKDLLKYLLVILFILFVTWGYGSLGFEWQGILVGLLTGYMLGVLFE